MGRKRLRGGLSDPAAAWADIAGAPVTVTADFFGLNFWQSATVAWPPPHLADIPYNYERVWLDFTGPAVCTWLGCEPSPGVYNFSGWGTKLSQDPTKKFLFTVGGRTPTFYTTDGSTYGPLKDLSVWSNYVNALCDWIVANDTRRQIAIMGPHNEPEAFAVFFYQGGDLDLAQRAATFYQVVKAKCPWILVMTPEVGAEDPAYFGTMLANGIGKSCDVVALHGYPPLVVPRLDFPALLPLMDQFLALKAQYAETASKPLLVTEGGYGNDVPSAGGSPFFSDDEQAGFDAQWYPGLFWKGATLACWYIQNAKHNANGTQAGWGTLVDQTSGNITAAGVADQQIKAWLTGATLTAFQQRGSQYRLKLTRPGGYAAELAFNNAYDGPYQFDVAATRLRDIAGNIVALNGSPSVWMPRWKPLLIETGAPS